jgi:TetR/AcrR family transcriptional repressor of nem operon
MLYQPVSYLVRSMSNTKDHIIEAASRLMHLQGFNHTSIDEVLRESGVGKGNFYYYFKSKEELGYAIIENNLKQFSQYVIGKAFGNHRDALSQVDDFLDIILELHRQRNCAGGCPLGNMAMELSDIHEGFRKKFQGIFESWRMHVSTVLQKAKESGQLSDHADPTILAQFIVAGVEGAILLTKVKRNIRVLENCFSELKKHIRMYIGDRIPLSQ